MHTSLYGEWKQFYSKFELDENVCKSQSTTKFNIYFFSWDEKYQGLPFKVGCNEIYIFFFIRVIGKTTAVILL